MRENIKEVPMSKNTDTLTDILKDTLMLEYDSEPQARANEDELISIKSAIKEWLKTVGAPISEPARHMLIVLVDEP